MKRHWLLLISLLCLPRLAFSAISLADVAYGETVAASLSVPGEVDTYTFEGQAGEAVLLHALSASSGFAPKLELFDPQGDLLAQGVLSSHPNQSWMARIKDQVLPSTGTYTMLVSDNSGSGTGTYGVSLQRSSSPLAAAALSYGDVVSDSIEALADIHTYTFMGAVGEELVVRVNATFNVGFYLFDPSGSLVVEAGGLGGSEVVGETLAQAGTYTLVVFGNAGASTGAYGLALQRLDGSPGAATALAYGDVVSASLDGLADFNTFTFEGQAGEAVLLHAMIAEPGLDPHLELYDPSGALLADGDDTGSSNGGHLSRITNQVLAETGTYTVVVRAEVGTGTGDYGLGLQRVDDPVGAVVLSYGDVVAASLAALGELDTYTFEAEAGDEVVLRLEQRFSFYLFGPEGQLIADTPSVFDLVGQTLEEAGTYTVVVFGRLEPPGAYDLSLKEIIPLAYEQSFENQQLRGHGDLNWYKIIVPSLTPLVIQVKKQGLWDATLRLQKGAPDFRQPFLSDTDSGNLEAVLVTAEADTFYVQVESSIVAETPYSILATDDLTQAKKTLIVDNDVLRADIAITRGTVTSLVYKQGSHIDLLAPGFNASLIDFGTDPNLGDVLARDWFIANSEVQADQMLLALRHPSGFANDMVLSWETDHVEVRCDVTVTEAVETHSILRPGGGWEAGRDRWAFPTLNGVETGSFSYPGSSAPLYPADGTWVAPSEGWTAFWDDQVDEVYGFTFSGGYQSRIMDGSGADFHFRFPVGTSRIAFQVVKPKPATPYEGLRTLASGPFLALSNEVNARFVTAGNELTYTLVYNNTGNKAASGTMLEVQLPSTLELVASSITGGGVYDAASRSINWSVGALPNDAEPDTVTFRATVATGLTEGTEIASTARIWATEQTVATSAIAVSSVGTPSISSVSPDTGGDTGTVTVTIEGSNLDPGAAVRLTKDGEEDIVADFVRGSTDGTQLTATLDLTEKAQGLWNVIIVNPNADSTSLLNEFAIGGGYVDLWVDIIGRDQIRLRQPITYSLVYGNAGNVDAWGSYIFLTISSGAEVYVKDVELAGTPNCDSESGSDSTCVQMILITNIPAKSKGEISLSLTGHIGVDSVKFGAVITSDMGAYIPIIDQYYVIPDSDFVNKSVSNEKNILHSSSQYPPWVPPTDFAIPPPGYILKFRMPPDKEGRREIQTGISLGDGRIGWAYPGDKVRIDNFSDYRSRSNWEYWGAFRPSSYTRQKGEEAVRRFESSLGTPYCNPKPGNTCPPGSTSCLGAVYRAWPDLKDEIWTAEGKPDSLDTTQLFEYLLEINFLDEMLVTESTIHWDIIPSWIRRMLLNISVVRSWDPNEKVSLTGFGERHFIVGERELPYSIFFENLETATAPAQEVFITDTLDVENLDLSTFSLGPIAFGERQVAVPPGLQSYSTEVDLRPENNLLLRIEGDLDSTTGVLTWHFLSLDPQTRGLPEDPLAGFLPPNLNPPEGEGNVDFTIMPKQNLSTDTETRNHATIVFDVNPPIVTPTWLNTFDNTAPESQVQPLAATQGNPSFDVQWSGRDEGAGIQDFTVYVSEDDGPFTPWLVNTPDTSATFTGEPDKTYAFYSVARDHTGHREAVPEGADASTVVAVGSAASGADLPIEFALRQNYPNPFNPTTTIEYDLPEPVRVRLVVYDLLGRRVEILVNEEKPAGRYKTVWDASRFASGVYFYRIHAGDFAEVRKVILVK